MSSVAGGFAKTRLFINESNIRNQLNRQAVFGSLNVSFLMAV
jgi:hypothetical protein